MNLASLYRITDSQIKEQIKKLKPADLTDDKIKEIKTWCTENNWGSKFQEKYRISMVNTPAELGKAAIAYRPLQLLIDETEIFSDSSRLHNELENAAFEMLKNKDRVAVALNVLFYAGNETKIPKDDFGSLSVAFDSQAAIDEAASAVSVAFVKGMNQALLDLNADEEKKTSDAVDAFGIPFEPLDDPMPTVKLAGGFEVALRTMFKGQPCHERYGRFESNTYPVSSQMRSSFQSALDWLGAEERKEITWINTARNEVLFVYPSKIPDIPISFTRMFQQKPGDQSRTFEEQARLFLKEVRQGKSTDEESHAVEIQLFILRKIDKARTKVMYTRLTDPDELEHLCEDWAEGSRQNLPEFSFGAPDTLFPLDVADVLNRFWKQNGDIATDKFKPVPRYHGIEILMDRGLALTADIHNLSEKAMTIGQYYGCKLVRENNFSKEVKEVKQLRELLSLMALLLYRSGVRKDAYMESLPYLYGQLLKAADELHAMYCKVVRSGSYPPQFVGGSMFQSAAEAPVRTLTVLGQRMSPYYTWAKSYRYKEEQWSKKARSLYFQCERITEKLYKSWTPATRFTDEEKALLFIGYLAKFQTKEHIEENTEEEQYND